MGRRRRRRRRASSGRAAGPGEERQSVPPPCAALGWQTPLEAGWQRSGPGLAPHTARAHPRPWSAGHGPTLLLLLLLTEQEQLHLLGRLFAVLAQVAVDHAAPLGRRLVLGAQRTAHGRGPRTRDRGKGGDGRGRERSAAPLALNPSQPTPADSEGEQAGREGGREAGPKALPPSASVSTPCRSELVELHPGKRSRSPAQGLNQSIVVGAGKKKRPRLVARGFTGAVHAGSCSPCLIHRRAIPFCVGVWRLLSLGSFFPSSQEIAESLVLGCCPPSRHVGQEELESQRGETIVFKT